VVLSIFAVAQATKCSKSLVKRDSPTCWAKGTDLSDYTMGWTPKAPQLTREPRLVSPDVEVSCSANRAFSCHNRTGSHTSTSGIPTAIG